MVDTAHSYTGGQSEETIGEALHPFPESCIVATKGGIGGPGRGRPEVLQPPPPPGSQSEQKPPFFAGATQRVWVDPPKLNSPTSRVSPLTARGFMPGGAPRFSDENWTCTDCGAVG